MAALHFRNATVYMGGTGVAVPVVEAAEFSLDVQSDTVPAPRLTDVWENKLRGLMRWSGSITGNFDNAQTTLWDAVLNTNPVPLYVYPNASTPTSYYYGSIWPKLGVSGGVSSKGTTTSAFDGAGIFAIK
jgi:hypothetical protein